MCWVMPPASPETTLVLRIASSSEVLPWSTWPMMVTTGGRGLRLPSSSPEAWTITSSTSESETRTTRWPNSSMISSAVSASIVWFCVAMMPFCIRVLTTAATRSAMRLASSCTVIASGMLHVAHHLLALARVARDAALVALLPALHRRHASAGGPPRRWRCAMVSLPARRRSSSPLPRLRFSSTAGRLRRRPSSGRPAGRPRRGRRSPAAAAGSTGAGGGVARPAAAWRASGVARAAPRPARRRPRRRAAPAISRSLARRSAASFSARSRASSAARASAASLLAAGGARPPGPWRPRPPSAGARTRRRERFGVVPPGRPGCGSGAGRRAWGPGSACACARP